MNLSDIRNRVREQYRGREKRAWYEFRNIDGDTASAAEVRIYDEITPWGVTADDFVRDLRALDADTIELRLNTPGGLVFDGIAIHNAFRDHPATVNVTVDGVAASIGSVIAMAGDTVTMNRGAHMMIHDAAGLQVGNAGDMREMADILDKLSNTIAGFYAGRAGGSTQDWRGHMLAETWYTAEEAVSAGLADTVAGGRSTQDGEDTKPSATNTSTADRSRLIMARHRARITSERV